MRRIIVVVVIAVVGIGQESVIHGEDLLCPSYVEILRLSRSFSITVARSNDTGKRSKLE